jgi:type II secretory pathway component PulM
MNVALGAAVVLCLLATLATLIWRPLSRAIRRRSIETGLNHEMQRMFGPPRPYSRRWRH